MKLNSKLLLIAAFFLALPLIFMAGDANAYIGDEMCISCHSTDYMTVRSTVDADPAAFFEMYNVEAYLQTGHKNTLRFVEDGVTLYAPDGVTPMTGITDTTVLIHHSWFDGKSAARAINEGVAFNCTPCHTTGYKADETAAYTATDLGLLSIGHDAGHAPVGATGLEPAVSGGSFELPGVQCEYCHGERNLNVYDCETIGYRWRLRMPGTVDNNGDGDMCDSGERVQTYFCGSSFDFADRFTMTATEVDETTPFIVPADEDTCGGAAVNSGHHTKVAGAVDIFQQVEGAATGAEVAAAVNGLCGKCHMAEHDAMQNFLNSAHSKFTGTMNLNDYKNPAKYDVSAETGNHFTANYGSCNGCHDPHKTVLTTVPNVVEGAIKGCTECHSPESPYTPDGGMKGFHDGILAEGTMPSTVVGGETGLDFDACLACHTSGGRDHVFRISNDPAYDGNRLTVYDKTEEQCKAEPGYQSWTASSSRCRYYALDSNGQISRGMMNACGSCHKSGGTAVLLPAGTYEAVVAAGGYHGGYQGTGKSMPAHPTGTGTPTDCTSCHKSDDTSADALCGSCHGGSAGAGATTGGSPYLSEETLAMYAPQMHSAANSGTVEQTGAEPVLPEATDCDRTLQATGTLSVSATACPADATGLQTCNIGVGGTVDIAATASQDTTVNKIWWGDGSGLDSAASHIYNNIGKFQVIQTVRNACGFTDQKVFIVNVTGGGTGKGTISLTSTGTTVPSYNVYAANSSVSITHGDMPHNVLLDGGDGATTGCYDITIGLPSGIVMPVSPSTPGTCSGPTGASCLRDADCPVTDYSTTPFTHETCTVNPVAPTCTLASSGTGTCTDNVGCTDVCVTAGTVVTVTATCTP